jgi:adenosylcobinamide-GDP ribazoletransferase
MIKKELHTLLTAVMFFTRIPVPGTLPYNKELLDRAIKYFPLVGALVGIWVAAIYLAFALVFPHGLAILFSMLAGIWLTGAFHEDGFADFCDGYGGGYTTERVLEIMKDSRLGTYGTIGLLGMLAVKWGSLSIISPEQVIWVMLSAHIFSRLAPVWLIYTSPYLRADENSKAKPLGNNTTIGSVALASLIAAIAVLWISPARLLVLLALQFLVFVIFRAYIMRRTGGYTGDVLGALQQLSEVTFYLAMAAQYNHHWL